MLFVIAIIAVSLGWLSRRMQRQQEALSLLRDLGGQLESPPVGPSTWITGIAIEDVRFLGPAVGDESVADICEASRLLGLNRITLMETRMSDHGAQQLRSGLPSVQIQMVAPIFDRLPDFATPRMR